MQTASKHVKARMVDDQLVAKLLNVRSLYDQSLILEIGTALKQLLAQARVRRMILNLSEIEFTATEMIARLVSLNRQARKAQIGLVLCELGPSLADSLKVLGLEKLFEIRTTEAEAIETQVHDASKETLEYPV